MASVIVASLSSMRWLLSTSSADIAFVARSGPSHAPRGRRGAVGERIRQLRARHPLLDSAAGPKPEPLVERPRLRRGGPRPLRAARPVGLPPRQHDQIACDALAA